MLAVVAFVLFMVCTGSAPRPVVFLIELLIGWWGYLGRTLPNVRMNWIAVISATVCITALLVLGHRLARWLWRETTNDQSRWRFRWTLAGVAVFVFMFVAGIAAVGVTHQSAWLARSDKPMFQSRRSRIADQVRCGSNLRQLGQAILLYAKEHSGKLPDKIEKLAAPYEIYPEAYVCPATDTPEAPGKTRDEQYKHLNHNHVSYVYHGKGLRLPLHPDTPLACEPLFNHAGAGMNILFADGHVDWYDAAEAAQVMRTVAQ
jgi:prepilin-type processing-associated H-X9-DG protein